MRKFGPIVSLLLSPSAFTKKFTSHTCIPSLPQTIISSSFATTCPAMVKAKTMEDWSFSESKLASLPLDPEIRNYVRQVSFLKPNSIKGISLRLLIILVHITNIYPL